MEVQRSNVGQIKLASGLTTLAGIWEILAPFVLGYNLDPPPTINAIIVDRTHCRLYELWNVRRSSTG